MASLERLPDTLAEIDNPLVGVIMGSDSDLKYTMPTYDVLDEFGVPYEVRIISAHRTPGKMHRYAEEAVGRGLLSIIAFAGGSSHLQGMTASETIIPVLGVAVEGSPDPLSSSFGSQLRMPSEAPLSVMGKNEVAATNAGLQVVRCLAFVFPELRLKLEERRDRIEKEVDDKDIKIQDIGHRAYRQEQIDAELRKTK